MVGRVPPGRLRSGYTLVALVILVAVMNVLVAAVLPLWSTAIQREKEEELIFRGLQYAEAIRVFQLRNGRLPVQLEELLEVKPRTIRQLWLDPFNPKGGWGLVLATQGAGGRQVAGGTGAERRAGRRRGRGEEEDQPDEIEPAVGLVDPSQSRGRRGRGRRAAAGPILGVYSLSEEKALKVFNGASSYKEWKFTTDLLPVSAGPAGGESVARLNSRWAGRPFPEGITPEEGGVPEVAGDDEQEDPGGRRRGRPKRPDRRRPGGRGPDG